MASKSSSLRHIEASGGLFTENILLRLRDKPDQLKIGRIESFIEKDTKLLRNQFEKKRDEIFKWCCDTWDDISPIIEKISLEKLIQQWLIPFFNQFGHELEEFVLNERNIDDDNPLKGFKIRFQSKDSKNPFFHFVPENENFKDNVKSNPQNHPYHNLCQELINFNLEIKWLFLSNGRLLRILTKYYHTYSTGYVQFDLENIFSNRDKKEFDTLFAMIHQSRFIDTSKEKVFLIDLFKKQSSSEGAKIGDALRFSVEKAIHLLGNSLIQQNPEFLDEILLIRDNLSDFLNDYYAELLRIIYRIIFILYAEKRKMLPVKKGIYLEHFSLDSMRKLAEKQLRVEKSRDLWKKLFITFRLVRDGNKLLEVNSFNGSLFKDENLSIIVGKNLSVTNDIIIRVIRLLTTFKDANIRQNINFSIEEEEIGSIYESLLDLKPHLASNSEFKLISQTAERKSTGSYYTPKSLIDILTRTTLQPLVEDKLKKVGNDLDKKKKAILDLKVCDPACGGGTFLLSALDFLGKKLAEVRTGSDSPLEDDLRDARREILQHCIYGVDINPLAVELAKISLWLRACVKDKPLNFLDNHIKCGNSLIGLGQKTDISGINPDAFKAVSGNPSTGIPKENTKLQNMARKIIRDEIKEQRKSKRKITTITAYMTDTRTADICSAKFQEIIDMSERDPKEIKKKVKRYEDLRKNENYLQALNEGNIWTSTFFWPFEGTALGEIPRYTTIEQLREKSDDPELEKLMGKIKNIAQENKFFHWYIEFPEVFSTDRGGFDCILTNPPWDVYTLKTDEFFAQFNEEIASARSKERAALIRQLNVQDPKLFQKYVTIRNLFEKGKNYFKNSDFYSYTAIGQLDVYPMFIERTFLLVNNKGALGVVCPNGFINSYSDFFKKLYNDKNIRQCLGFINTKKIFSDVASQKQFITLSLSKKKNQKPSFQFNIEEVENAFKKENYFYMNYDDLVLINPLTITPPFVKNHFEFSLLIKIYKNSDLLMKNIKQIEKKMKIHRMFHITDDRRKGLLFYKEELEKKRLDFNENTQIYKNEKSIYYPAYEGKLIYHYDYLHGTYKDVDYKTRTSRRSRCNINHTKNLISAEPRYWVERKEFIKKISEWDYQEKWFLCYREATGPKNNRTIIFTILPWFPTVYTIYCYYHVSAKDALILLSQFNTYIMDFVFRKKMATNHLTQDDIAQLPFIPMELIEKNFDIILPLVWELVYFNESLRDLAEELKLDSKIFNFNKNRRFELMRRLDAIYACLWGLKEEDVIYILDDFNVEKKREIEIYGEFRSQQDILRYIMEYEKTLRR